MNFIVKVAIILYTSIEIIMIHDIAYQQFVILLLIIAINIFKERYYDSVYLTIVTLLLTCAAVTMDFRFSVLFALCSYDFMLKRIYVGLGVTAACMTYFLRSSDLLPTNLLFILFCSLLAYVIRSKKEERERFKQTVDNERRLRYELEDTKAKLLHSSKEVANIAEVRERNRIAQEIHDSIGHSIAGILFQLQAAYKLHPRNQEKSLAMIQNSIEGLANSVELLRDTVHNIKPKQHLGINYIKNIIDHFNFCPVELQINGDVNSIPASHLELLSTNLKEALTNASRYSQATKIDVKIETTEQYERLYIKDNGIGCNTMKEGLGLSGMRERVRNVGGSLSISTNDGFLIVCLIPKEGSGIFESSNR
ncbi:integral membrane sensor signal transduction histidine kinase [Neobacillus bataviensis LMG 21833]|uniref:histidine kinase n=1 Tax=Neobacillus bataviensis LMG 21833 TaxID=1117379 RepID=K6EDZ7_9BACI|nr:sensor histidine kinase [Neobacillus bataviensis]EKN71706.1 integral membrane sensor signal transduction histidine kinase [Neobacillus bataviensis LMG 21833]